MYKTCRLHGKKILQKIFLEKCLHIAPVAKANSVTLHELWGLSMALYLIIFCAIREHFLLLYRQDCVMYTGINNISAMNKITKKNEIFVIH